MTVRLGPNASGLAKKLKIYESVYIIHFLCNALKPQTAVTLVFEKKSIDLTVMKPMKDLTINCLNQLKKCDRISTKRASKLLQVLNI